MDIRAFFGKAKNQDVGLAIKKKHKNGSLSTCQPQTSVKTNASPEKTPQSTQFSSAATVKTEASSTDSPTAKVPCSDTSTAKITKPYSTSSNPEDVIKPLTSTSVKCICKGEVVDQLESPNEENIKKKIPTLNKERTTTNKRMKRVLLSDDSDNADSELGVIPRKNTPNKRRRRVLSEDSDNTDSEVGMTPQKDDDYHKSVSSPSYSCSSITPSKLTSSTKNTKRPAMPVNTLAPRFKCSIVSEIEKRSTETKPPGPESNKGTGKWLGGRIDRATPPQLGSKIVPRGRKGCLEGLTFVLSGVLNSLKREEAEDIIKSYGGKCTGGVSGKTSFLLLGTILDDGRLPEEGSKHKHTIKVKTRVIDEDGLFDMLLQSNVGNVDGEHGDNSTTTTPAKSGQTCSSSLTAEVKPITTAAAASVHNPYASMKSATTSSTTTSTGKTNGKGKALPRAVTVGDSDGGCQLWVDKYKPEELVEIIGNGGQVKKLKAWLQEFHEQRRFENLNKKKKGSKGKANPSSFAVALISGPPGIGKTTAARVVAQSLGFHIIEFNASDTRNKMALDSELRGMMGTSVLNFGGVKEKQQQQQRRVIIMDEVDGMGAGDRGGLAELTKIIKISSNPIICICNDRQSPKMKTLTHVCLDLRFQRPQKGVIARRMQEVAAKEGLDLDTNAAEVICESCGNDIRQILNALQMWRSQNTTMTYMDAKKSLQNISKDSVQRLSGFDAARLILDRPYSTSFNNRNEAFFQDYQLVPLLVQENWISACLKVPQEHVMSTMERIAQASSDAELIAASIRGDGTQHWELLPLQAAMTIRIGSILNSPSAGFPNFPSWFGKNSSTNKGRRIISDLQAHMNFHVSGDANAIRMSYIPGLSRMLSAPLLASVDPSSALKTVKLLDEYGLSRDDMVESIGEFSFSSGNSNPNPITRLTTAGKTALTRAYNASAHHSQALVSDINLAGKKGKGGGKNGKNASVAATSGGEFNGEEIMNDEDDTAANEVVGEEEEDDIEAIAKAFVVQVKKGKPSSSSSNHSRGKKSKSRKE